MGVPSSLLISPKVILSNVSEKVHGGAPQRSTTLSSTIISTDSICVPMFIFTIILFAQDTKRPLYWPFCFWFFCNALVFFQKFPIYCIELYDFVFEYFIYCCCCCYRCRNNNGRQIVIFPTVYPLIVHKIMAWVILYNIICIVVVGTATFLIC